MSYTCTPCASPSTMWIPSKDICSNELGTSKQRWCKSNKPFRSTYLCIFYVAFNFCYFYGSGDGNDAAWVTKERLALSLLVRLSFFSFNFCERDRHKKRCKKAKMSDGFSVDMSMPSHGWHSTVHICTPSNKSNEVLCFSLFSKIVNTRCTNEQTDRCNSTYFIRPHPIIYYA